MNTRTVAGALTCAPKTWKSVLGNGQEGGARGVSGSGERRCDWRWRMGQKHDKCSVPRATHKATAGAGQSVLTISASATPGIVGV